jgi:hypothetical protein
MTKRKKYPWFLVLLISLSSLPSCGQKYITLNNEKYSATITEAEFANVSKGTISLAFNERTFLKTFDASYVTLDKNLDGLSVKQTYFNSSNHFEIELEGKVADSITYGYIGIISKEFTDNGYGELVKVSIADSIFSFSPRSIDNNTDSSYHLTFGISLRNGAKFVADNIYDDNIYLGTEDSSQYPLTAITNYQLSLADEVLYISFDYRSQSLPSSYYVTIDANTNDFNLSGKLSLIENK